MAKTLYHVPYNGELISLKRWASIFGVNYDIALRRWKEGVRDPEELAFTENEPEEITEEDIEWLKRTRRCRRGMENEWFIACDLIGQPYSRIDEIKELVES